MANGITTLLYMAALLSMGVLSFLYYALDVLLVRAQFHRNQRQINISQTFRKQFQNNRMVS